MKKRKRKKKKSSRGFKMDNEYKNEDRKESLKSSDEQKADEETSTEERNVDSYGEPIENPESDEEPKKKKVISTIIELLLYAAIIVMCVCVVPKYVLQRTIVDGTSMMNTLKDGDNLLVEKVTYRFSEPKRFDVIVFYPHGRESNDYYIKRVIGLPGETIQIKGNTIYINGKVIKENYGKDPMTESGIAEEPLKLAKDEFFVLGDNREISDDSRYPDVGPVKKKNIAGRAILRISPLSEFGTFK